MKKIYFWPMMLFSALCMPSCYFGGVADSSHLIVSASETELKDNRGKRDSNKGGDCEEDSGCEDVCEEVYNDEDEEENEGKVETCIKLRYKIAIQFEDILDILEEPYDSNLENIDEKAFTEFLDVSVQPWVTAVKKVGGSNEVKALLSWIAKESGISRAIEEAYKNYEINFDKYEGVIELFEELENSGNPCSRFCKAIDETSIVGTSKSFWDVAGESGNSSAQDIACNILTQKCNEEPERLQGCTDSLVDTCSLF